MDAMMLLFVHKAVAESEDGASLFCGLERFHRRLCPAPLPAGYWLETCAVVDVLSVQLSCAWALVITTRGIGQATLDMATWLGPMLTHAIQQSGP